MTARDISTTSSPLTFRLNGQTTTVAVRPDARLLDVLRDEAHLCGVKEGCGEGECGACAVLLDGQPVCSCVVFAATVDGCDVTTVEGLPARAGHSLHPVQAHFLREMGTQCGFCTPGMVIAAVALLEDKPHATRAEILDGISGNLCRCTGYTRILRAIENARDEMQSQRDTSDDTSKKKGPPSEPFSHR